MNALKQRPPPSGRWEIARAAHTSLILPSMTSASCETIWRAVTALQLDDKCPSACLPTPSLPASVLERVQKVVCVDMLSALNVPASSTASRPGRPSFSRHYGRSVGKDHRTLRHSGIRSPQARARTQPPPSADHPPPPHPSPRKP